MRDGLCRFGKLLARFRSELGFGRGNARWLGQRLGLSPSSAPSSISRWENGEKRPTRRQIIGLGVFLCLRPDCVDELLAAVRQDLVKNEMHHAEEYRPLSTEEIHDYQTIHGPWDIPKWQDRLASAKQANINGDLNAALHETEQTLVEIENATRDDNLRVVPWSEIDLTYTYRLYLDHAAEYYYPLLHLIETSDLNQVYQPLVIQARAIARKLSDPDYTGLVDVLEAEYHHAFKDAARAGPFAGAALRRLDPSRHHTLKAFAQRLYMIDGKLAPNRLRDEITIAYRMIETAPGDDPRGRGELLAGNGESLAHLQDAGCWPVLEEAEREMRLANPSGYLHSIRAQMKTILGDPKGVDGDRLYDCGKRGLEVAKILRWDRNAEQISNLAWRGGVILD